MRKKIFVTVATLVIAVALVAALVACDRTPPAEAEHFSHGVDALYTGGGEDFVVSLECGERENPFIADGKTGTVEEFAELVVTPLAVGDYDEISFVLKEGGEAGKTLSGTLGSNRFGEFRVDVPLDFVPASVTLTAGELNAEYPLADVLAGKLTSRDAVNIARQEFAAELEAEKAEGGPEREVYVRLITGDRTTYYYYVSLIGEGANYLAVLVNPDDGTVVSKK